MVNVILITFLVIQNLVKINVSDFILEEERKIYMKVRVLLKKGYFYNGRNKYQKYSLVCGLQ